MNEFTVSAEDHESKFYQLALERTPDQLKTYSNKILPKAKEVFEKISTAMNKSVALTYYQYEAAILHDSLTTNQGNFEEVLRLWEDLKPELDKVVDEMNPSAKNTFVGDTVPKDYTNDKASQQLMSPVRALNHLIDSTLPSNQTKKIRYISSKKKKMFVDNELTPAFENFIRSLYLESLHTLKKNLDAHIHCEEEYAMFLHLEEMKKSAKKISEVCKEFATRSKRHLALCSSDICTDR